MRTAFLATAALLPALAVVAVVLAPAPDAAAKPEYAAKEKKACAFCHVAARGGGARNAQGDEYARNGHKLAAGAPRGFGEDNAFKTEANWKQYQLVLAAIQWEHWGDALKRLDALKAKEDKKGPAFPKLTASETTVLGRGRDLVNAAREAIQGGKAPEAAANLVRVELEFKGRDVAKDVAKHRAELLKLPGGKEAETKARADQPLRVLWLDAQMKCTEGDTATAAKLLQDLVTKSPEGPFAAQAKAKLEELKASPAPAAAMGG